MAKDLLYRPNLKYDKNYYTEGKIESDNNNDNKEDRSETSSKEDIINNAEQDLVNKLSYLSDDIKNTYLPSFYGMHDEYNRIIREHDYIDPEIPDPKIPDPPFPDDGEIEPEDPPKPPGDDDYIPLFDRVDDVYIDVKDPLADKVKIIKETYYINFIDIYQDYLNKVNIIIDNYKMTTFQALMLNSKAQVLDYTTKAIKNKNIHHLSDFLIKSDITLIQMMRLHKKLFQIDEIILHIRMIRVTKDQLIRYCEETEVEQETFLDVDSNIILKESIRVAEKKYEESLYALYKYLNSSVILLDESLKTVTKQNKAMIIINNKEEMD